MRRSVSFAAIRIICGNPREILADETINLVVSAPVRCERAALGLAAMRHGKDYLSDKLDCTTLDQLTEAGVLPQSVAPTHPAGLAAENDRQWMCAAIRG